jgi:hypothetical protein
MTSLKIQGAGRVTAVAARMRRTPRPMGPAWGRTRPRKRWKGVGWGLDAVDTGTGGMVGLEERAD